MFTRLLDDAAMFPPGNASAASALTQHLRHRDSWYADLVGPLLVPAIAFEAFAAAHAAAGGPSIDVVLIGTTTLPSVVPDGVTVTGFEAPVPDVPLPQTPDGLTFAAELTRGGADARVLAAVGEQSSDGRLVVAKFRTGGTASAAFPSEEALAGVLTAAVAARAPLKLTAGLHSAVRHTDAVTGFEHHGFLNVLLATVQALDGTDAGTVAATLAIRDAAILCAQTIGIAAQRLVAARRWFVSFGCCGVEDPVAGLSALGLLEAPA